MSDRVLRIGIAVSIGVVGPLARIIETGSDRLASVIVLVVLGFGVVGAHAGTLRTRIVAGAAIAASLAFAWPLEVRRSAAVVAAGCAVAAVGLLDGSIRSASARSARPAAVPALAVVAVGEVLWYRHGSPVVFAPVCAVAGAIAVVWARHPGARARWTAGIHRIGSTIGRAMTDLMGAVAFGVLVMPIGLLLRLVRVDPLENGWSRPDSTWLPGARLRRPRPERRAARSLAQPEFVPSTGARRRRAALAVALAIGAAGATYAAFEIRGATAHRPPRRHVHRGFEDDPAFPRRSLKRTLRVSLLGAWNNIEFNGAVGAGGSAMSPRSSSTSAAEARNPALRTRWASIRDLVLRGSAAFGAGQRNDHTIASELVALADRRSATLEVHNFGVPATTNWQTAVLMIEKLAWNPPPDLVVVYDGANDVGLQGALVAKGNGDSDEPASIVDAELDLVLRERAAAGGSTTVPTAESTPPDTTPPPPEQMAARIAVRYRRGVELIRASCERAGVDVLVAWQPDLRAKEPTTSADRETLASVNAAEAGVARWRAISAAARASLSDLGVLDLTEVFNGRTEAIYWDTVHTNETGAALVAEALYPSIAERLDIEAAPIEPQDPGR
ncbi:MAG: hypothetical protein IPG46_18380 [Actinobacteria bacterium]|nr:hypothetical protein [Actinomycetota bacterium]